MELELNNRMLNDVLQFLLHKGFLILFGIFQECWACRRRILENVTRLRVGYQAMTHACHMV